MPGLGRTLAPAPWGPGEAIAGTLLCILAALLVGGGVFAVTGGLPCGAQSVVGGLAGEMAFGVSVLVWVRFAAHAPLSALGLPREPAKDLLTGFVGGIGLTVVAYVALAVVYAVGTLILGHSPAEPQQVPSCVQGVWLWLMAPVVIIAAPLGEETLFRGFLFRGMRSRLSVWPSALVSGAIFGLIHGYWVLIPALAAVGVCLALIYERRGSLLASMTAHATFNLIGLLLIVVAR